ncbi:MAG: DNA polymerase III subunit alpha [Phycisphaerae bacterium]
MNRPPDITPLQSRSGFSLLRGTAGPEELVRRAADLGHRRLAMTDVNSLAGAPRFHHAAVEADIEPIIGAELRTGEISAVALVRDPVGYQNLCLLLTQIQCGDSDLYRCPFDAPDGRSAWPGWVESIPAAAEGIEWVFEDLRLVEHLRQRGLAETQIWLGIDPPTQRARTLRDLLDCAERTALPLVALGRALLRDADDLQTARLLAAIGTRTTIDNVPDDQMPSLRATLRAPQTLAEQLAPWPEAVRNNQRLSGRCAGYRLLPRRATFPRFACPDGLDAPTYLRRLCQEGLLRRYRNRPPFGAEQRLQRELGLIEKLGFSGYFLIVRDIVQFARRQDVPVAGRGSGASSIVAYLLGITNVCPIHYDIPFERFLHEQREDFPDLDIDFCWRIRDDVIDYAFRRWGRDHTAMVSTHNCFQPRSAFRETAKATGLSDAQISRMIETGRDPDNLAGRINRLARRITGLPHLLSVHPGGIVITPGRIDRHVPLVPAAKGVLITQMDKNGVEDINLVKLDLLGNRNLSTVRAAGDLIRRRHNVRIDIEQVPPDDPGTIETLCRGDTIGCNQLESPAMRHLLAMMQPRDTRDVMKILALIRPGAASIGMKEVFIRRHRGLENVPPAPEAVEQILGPTCGVMLYEDDVMLVAAAMLDCDLAEADRFRKAVQKCPDDTARLALSRQFLARCVDNGIDLDYAKSIWVQMAKYNAYSFCRAHAASYAQLAYAGAYLKTHFPVEFWTACLNNNQSMYPHRLYLEQAKRDGVRFAAPDVNRSEADFCIDDGRVRIGLNFIDTIGPVGVETILSQRQSNGPYDGLTDLLLRTQMGKAEARSLILSGACDSFGRNRPTLMIELNLFARFKPACRPGGPMLLNSRPVIPDAPDDYSPAEQYIQQRDVLGMTPGAHILSWYRPQLAGRVDTVSTDLPDRIGHGVRIAGMIEARRTTPTSRGEVMTFLTLDDEFGTFEVTIFPDLRDRLRCDLNRYGPYLVEGRIESQYGALSLRATRLDLLEFLPVAAAG